MQNKELLRKIVANVFYPNTSTNIKTEYLKGITYFERFKTRSDLTSIFITPSTSDELHLAVFLLLDFLSRPCELETILKLIRDGYKHDHFKDSIKHNLPHAEIWSSVKVYEAINDFTYFLIKMFQDFRAWGKIENPTTEVNQFLEKMASSEITNFKKLHQFQIKRCCQQYALFSALYIAKYIGLYPYVDGIAWSLTSEQENAGIYSKYNIFNWMIHLLKMKSLIQDDESQKVPGDDFDDDQHEGMSDGDMSSQSFIEDGSMYTSPDEDKKLPIHFFHTNVLQRFANLFTIQVSKTGNFVSSPKFPWTYKDFLEQQCHIDFDDFFSLMCNQYKRESHDFFQPLIPGSIRYKKKKKVDKKVDGEQELDQAKKRKVDQNHVQGSLPMVSFNGTGATTPNDVLGSASRPSGTDVFTDSSITTSLTRTSMVEISKISVPKHSSFFCSALQFLVQGLGDEALNFNYSFNGSAYNTDKFNGGQSKMKLVVDKIKKGVGLSADDVLSIIDLSMVFFQDANGNKYLKFTEMVDVVEQDIDKAIEFLVINCWTNLLLIDSDENVVIGIRVEPTVSTHDGAIQQRRSLCSDMKSSLMFHQLMSVEGSEIRYQMTNADSNYFIVKICRITEIQSTNNTKKFFEVDTMSIINTEAVRIVCIDDSQKYGVLQAFVVASKEMHFVTFVRIKNEWMYLDGDKHHNCSEQVRQLTGLGYFFLYKTCTEVMYRETLLEATLDKESLAKKVHDYASICAVIYEPSEIDNLTEIVQIRFNRQWKAKNSNCPEFVEGLYFDRIEEVLEQLFSSKNTVDYFKHSGYRLILQDILLRFANCNLAGQIMLHNWWQNLDEHLSTETIKCKVKEIVDVELTFQQLQGLKCMLQQKLIDYTEAPSNNIDNQGQMLQFCNQCHLVKCNALGICVFCSWT